MTPEAPSHPVLRGSLGEMELGCSPGLGLSACSTEQSHAALHGHNGLPQNLAQRGKELQIADVPGPNRIFCQQFLCSLSKRGHYSVTGCTIR